MGATISTGKKSAVLIKDDGSKIFALFEKTHESNVYPHTPRWSCIGIGEYNDILHRIFMHAASCEGGGLQGSGRRHIKPENYITAWQRELVSPALLLDTQIFFQVGGGIGASVSKDGLPEVCDALIRLGRKDLAEPLRLGHKVSIRLMKDIEIVLAIYGIGKIESAWRAIDDFCCSSLPYPEFGKEKRTGKISPPVVRVLATDQYKAHDRQNRLLKVGDKPWRNAGWEYRTVHDYILDVALHCELISTGSAKSLISDFREQCKNAESVSGDVQITFTRCEEGDDVHKWHVENFDKLAWLLGCGHEPIAPDTFIREFCEIRANDDALYLFSNLSHKQYQWHIEKQIATSEVCSHQQMDLLAAV